MNAASLRSTRGHEKPLKRASHLRHPVVVLGRPSSTPFAPTVSAERSASDDGVLEQNRALTAPMRAAGTAPVCCVQLGPSSWEVRRQQPMGPLLPVGTGIGRGPIEIGSWPGPTRLVVGRSGELISTMPFRPWARMNDAGIVGSRRV